MHLKTFTAPNMAEAMKLVRADMGDDAIIVSTGKADDGASCRITAALDEPEPDFAAEADATPVWTAEERNGYLRQVLTAHSMPPYLVERTARDAAEIAAGDPALALAGAIDARYRFRMIDPNGQKAPIVLVGVPGSGKTITAAKLSARCRIGGRRAAVATTDTRRAGGVEQLAAFMRILEIDLIAADTPDELMKKLPDRRERDLAVIDTGGVNPFDAGEMAALGDIITAADGEPVLVMPAGGDAMESADIAAAFADLGARRMIVTRLDMTRRLGGLLAAASAGGLGFAGVSVNPYVAEGLTAINPVSLAQLIVPDDPPPPAMQEPRAEARR